MNKWVVMVLLVVAIIASGCSIGELLAKKPASDSAMLGKDGPQTDAQGTISWQVGRLAWFAVPAIVGGILMAFMGLMKPGLAVAGGGGVLLAVSMAVARYAAYIEFVGVALIVGLCVYLVVTKTRVLSVYQKALAEVVDGVQGVKTKLLAEGATKAVANTILANAQSEPTKKLVKEIKGA